MVISTYAVFMIVNTKAGHINSFKSDHYPARYCCYAHLQVGVKSLQRPGTICYHHSSLILFIGYIFCHRFMDNLPNRSFRNKFLSYSNGMNTISERLCSYSFDIQMWKNTSVFYTLENVVTVCLGKKSHRFLHFILLTVIKLAII